MKRVIVIVTITIMVTMVIMDPPSVAVELTLPIPVKRTLRKLGHHIRDARRRRRIPAAIAAERASISRATLVKVERAIRA